MSQPANIQALHEKIEILQKKNRELELRIQELNEKLHPSIYVHPSDISLLKKKEIPRLQINRDKGCY